MESSDVAGWYTTRRTCATGASARIVTEPADVPCLSGLGAWRRMQRHVRLAFAASIAFFLPACGGLDSLGPTPFDEGIIFYVHAALSGSAQQINSDVRDLGDAEGPCGVASAASDPAG